MAKGSKKSGHTSQGGSSISLIELVSKATLIGVIVIVTMLGLLSLIVNAKDVSISVVDVATMLIVIMGCWSASYWAAGKKREDGMILGAMCGLSIFVIMLGVSLLYDPVVSALALIKLAICVLSGSIGGVLGVNVRKTRK